MPRINREQTDRSTLDDRAQMSPHTRGAIIGGCLLFVLSIVGRAMNAGKQTEREKELDRISEKIINAKPVLIEMPGEVEGADNPKTMKVLMSPEAAKKFKQVKEKE